MGGGLKVQAQAHAKGTGENVTCDVTFLGNARYMSVKEERFVRSSGNETIVNSTRNDEEW